jgi:heat-inducible transcriptional repressor
MALDERKSRILNALVYRYIITGQPVGSKALAETLNLGISPATIRNELSALEDMGYLYQPHISAGRVPTYLGYRFYVDSLAGSIRLGVEEKKAILALFSSKTRELEQLLRETTHLLSRLTRAAAMVIAPRLERNCLKHIDLVSLREDLLLMVVITDTGRVEKMNLTLNSPVKPEDIEKVQGYLNEKLAGKKLDQLESMDTGEFLRGVQEKELARAALEGIMEMMFREEYEKVYVGGAVNLLRGLDEEGLEKIEGLLRKFEEQYHLLHMLREVIRSNKLVVRIGDENMASELRSFSLIATPYNIGDEMAGTVSVLGPTRMDYARVIPTVDFIARSLSRALETLTG